jgi:hypothetical protein
MEITEGLPLGKAPVGKKSTTKSLHLSIPFILRSEAASKVRLGIHNITEGSVAMPEGASILVLLSALCSAPHLSTTVEGM